MTKTLTLPCGREVLLDRCDYERLSSYRWVFNEHDGVYRHKDRKAIKLHREVVNAQPRQHVRHINGNRLDCRRENLKPVGYKPIPPQPNAPYALIPTDEGRAIVLDASDFECVNQHLWRLHGGLPETKIGGKCVPLKQFLMHSTARVYNLDGNLLNCRRNNLSFSRYRFASEATSSTINTLPPTITVRLE